MQIRRARRGGLVGLVAGALLVAGTIPASAAPGDGSAYGVWARVKLATTINVGPVPEASTNGQQERSAVTVDQEDLKVHVLRTRAKRAANGDVESSAAVADVMLRVGTTTIKAKVVEATCTATKAGTTGDAKLAYLQIGDAKPIVDHHPAVGESVKVSDLVVSELLEIRLNEQISNADSSLTVNAIHIKVLGGAMGLVGGDVIISSATCGPAGEPMTNSTNPPTPDVDEPPAPGPRNDPPPPAKKSEPHKAKKAAPRWPKGAPETGAGGCPTEGAVPVLSLQSCEWVAGGQPVTGLRVLAGTP